MSPGARWALAVLPGLDAGIILWFAGMWAAPRYGWAWGDGLQLAAIGVGMLGVAVGIGWAARRERSTLQD